MKRFTQATSGLLLMLVLLLPATAQASPVELIVRACTGSADAADAECRDLVDLVRQDRDIGTLEYTATFTDGSLISIVLDFDVDPFINAMVGATNATALTQTYGFVFQTPVVSGMYDTALLEADATLSGNQTGAQAVMDQSGTVAYTRALAGIGTAGTELLTLGSGVCTTTSSTLCGYGSTSLLFAPALFDVMRMELLFTLNPGGSASWDTRYELTNTAAVPEPGSLLLVATGMAAVLRRRRKAA